MPPISTRVLLLLVACWLPDTPAFLGCQGKGAQHRCACSLLYVHEGCQEMTPSCRGGC